MGISEVDLASGLGEAEFEWRGHTVHIAFRIDAINQDFQRRQMLSQRRMGHLEAAQRRLIAQIGEENTADPDSPEYVASEKAAEAALAKIDEWNSEAIRTIDKQVIELFVEWDVTRKDGSMTPFTPEALFPLNLEFKLAALRAVIGAAVLGEANGSNSLNSLPTPSQLEAEQVSGLPSQEYSGILGVVRNGAEHPGNGQPVPSGTN